MLLTRRQRLEYLRGTRYISDHLDVRACPVALNSREFVTVNKHTAIEVAIKRVDNEARVCKQVGWGLIVAHYIDLSTLDIC